MVGERYQYLNGNLNPGFLCYGVPIGTDQYVEYMLDCKIEEIARDLRKIEETLTEHRQAMWNVIRSSISQKLDYWLTLVYPSQMLKAATRMDALLKGAVENLIGIEIPMDGSGGLGYESPIHIPVMASMVHGSQHLLVASPPHYAFSTLL